MPPTSSDGLPAITQPNVYFGLGETGYVVANTKQLEVDYQKNGTSVESHYKGTGGVQLSSIFTRAAFALRLGDFNLLISSQITDKSRIMFVRDPVAMAQKAAPFLTFDHDPYAVINSGRAGSRAHRLDRGRLHDDGQLPVLAERRQPAGRHRQQPPGSYNYVRKSVKVVIDAYSGKMTFYDADPKDPILQAYSAAFPNMFVPLSKMPGGAPGAPALPGGHLLHSVRHLRPVPPDQPAGLLLRQQCVAALAHGRRRPAVAGAAGGEHVQQPGSADLHHSGPHGAAVPGVFVAGHQPTNRSSRSRTVSSRHHSRPSRARARTST